MATGAGRTIKELLLILEGLRVPCTQEEFEAVRKGCLKSVTEEMSLLAIRATKATPEGCNFEYDAEKGVVRPLREARAENLRYSQAVEADLEELVAKLSTSEQRERMSRAERLYALFADGKIGCSVESMTSPHVSNIFYMDHKERCCYPLSSKDGMARLGPIIVQKASRTTKLSLQKEAERIQECRARIVALLSDGTTSGGSEKKKAKKEKSGKRKRHHSESDSVEEEARASESSSSSSYSLSHSDSAIGDSISASRSSVSSESSESGSESESSEEKPKKSVKKSRHHHRDHHKKSKKHHQKEKKKEKKEKKHKKPTVVTPVPTPPPKTEKKEKKKTVGKVEPNLSTTVPPKPVVAKEALPAKKLPVAKPVKEIALPSVEKSGKLTERLSELNQWLDEVKRETLGEA
jgi:hypothetical protein